MADNEETPRPSKKQSTRQNPLPNTPSLPRPSSVSSASTDVESHQSGRVSPTKQMTTLKDAEEPTLFYDFGCSKARLAEDAEAIRRGVQPLADHRGILGHKKKELALYSSDKGPLHATERGRFACPEAHDPAYSKKLGTVVPLETVQTLVEEAMDCETNQAHEDVWNEEVHRPLISMAKRSSLHAQALRICSLKSTTVNPKSLLPSDLNLPRRVIDYAFTLIPDAEITAAWDELKILPSANAKSWNNVTTEGVREQPIAINIETKAPNKSWTDGKPQLGIWVKTLLTRLRKLPDYRSHNPRLSDDLVIPAMPLVIAQGHDWHLLIVSQVRENGKLRTLIWQKIDIGSTRTCFDTYRLIAVFHWLANWAENTWRPWFHSLVA